VNQLAAQLRRSNRLGAPQLETAFRRQQIYGGSLDTVLLELDLLGARELLEELTAMSGLPPAPVDMLSSRMPRSWDALPRDLVDLGWVMPLGEREGRLFVVCHPDLPDERLADLRRAVDNVQPTIAPECLLARLAGERTESVVPQRYAVLSVRVLQDLRPRTGGAAAPPAPVQAPAAPRSQAPAPWLSGPASRAATPIANVPPPPAITRSAEPRPEPRPTPRPSAKARPVRRQPTWTDEAARATTMPPTVNDDEESFAGVLDDDDDKPFTPDADAPRALTERLRERTAPAAAPPPAVYNPPTPAATADVPQRRLEERTGPIAAAPPVRMPSMLRPGPPNPGAPVEVAVDESAFATAQARLEAATERDQITQALLDAAAVLSPRAALFSVRRDGLHVMHASDGLEIDRDTVVTMGAQVEEALANARPLEQVRDLDLRLAVGLERPDPCLFEPVTVRERAVLVLYVDREGAEFDAADRERARALCSMASRGLEALLARRVSSRSDAPTPAPAPASVKAPPAPAPQTPPPPPTPPATPPPVSARPGPLLAPPPATTHPVADPSPAPDRDKSDSIPKLVAAAPTHRSNTLTGHERPPAALFKPPPPSSRATAPPMSDAPPNKPPVRFAPPPASTQPRDTPVEEGPVDPMKITLVSGGAPPVRPPPTRATPAEPEPPPRPDSTTKGPIVALSQPLSQPTTRGRLALDAEDVETSGQFDLGSESLTARIDKSLDRVMRDLTPSDELTQFGDAALLRIAATFPGPLDVIRRDIDALPPPSAHGPLLRLCIRIGRPMSPYLIELMDHPNQALRFFSAFVFQELRDPRCMPALVERAFDPDADVRTVAMRVLETYARAAEYAEVVGRVRDELGSDNVTRQIHAARAAGTLRDTQATAPLIDALTSRDRYLQEAALESLCSITGQQLGLKAHRWRAWYGEHQYEHRVEWIISSLSHKDVSVRRWAGDELRRITGQPFVFPAAGDRNQRDGAIRQWREWWDREGRARMTGQNA